MTTTRKSFDHELGELQNEILKMGSLVEEAIHNAVQSLAKKDVALAQKTLDNDDVIDDMETAIEEHCLKLIARQQPMAKDLRKIGTGLKIVTDLERMADLACDIARVTIRLKDQPLIKPLVDIPRMARITQTMVREALDAYIHVDTDLAKAMCVKDDDVDAIFNQIFRELLTYMMEDPHTITQATQLLFVGRYLERIADHATNIGEWIVYMVTGEHLDLNQ